MSNEELQSKELTTEDSVEKRRRFIKGAGIAAPIVLSLANRSAFGQSLQCTSQQLSGNLSDPASAGSCESGSTPTQFRDSIEAPSSGSRSFSINSTPRATIVEQDKTDSSTTATYRVKASYSGSASRDNGSKNDDTLKKEPKGDDSEDGDITIEKVTNVTKKTYKWYGTDFIYGVLTITETIIDITDKKRRKVSSEVTVKSLTSSGTGEVKPGDKFTAGKVLEYTGSTSGPNGTPITVKAQDIFAELKLPAAKGTDYTGGSTFHDGFGDGQNTSMRGILCDDTESEYSSYVTAMLNASYIPAFNYVFTVDAVKTLYKGGPFPTGYASRADFLKSTW